MSRSGPTPSNEELYRAFLAYDSKHTGSIDAGELRAWSRELPACLPCVPIK